MRFCTPAKKTDAPAKGQIQNTETCCVSDQVFPCGYWRFRQFQRGLSRSPWLPCAVIYGGPDEAIFSKSAIRVKWKRPC